MRPVEAILLLTDALALLALVTPLPPTLRWVRLSAPAALLIFGVQAVLERPRWQMVPAYVLTGLLFLAWLLQSGASAAALAGQGWLIWPAIVMGALGLVVSVALPIVLPVFRFPQPTGPYGIGAVTYHWVDTARQDVFSSDPADRRELMVQVWYPARGGASAPHAPYVDDARVLGPLARLLRAPEFALGHLGLVTTNAVVGAPVADDEPSYPLLLFSHGRAGFRTHNTLQVEELASHGYVVATIDHPHVAAGVAFPDGRVAPFDGRMFDLQHVGHPPFLDRVIAFLAQDAIFALDQLTVLNEADDDGLLTGRLDLRHAGMFGVSLGGVIAAETCLLEPRLRACMAMDVFMPADVVRSGLKQPTLLMTRDAETMKTEGWAQADIDETQSTVRAVFEGLTEDGYLALVPGLYHADFADLPLMTPLASRLGLSGSIDGRRAHRIISTYMLAFFDRYLKGAATTLLDGPTDQFPEVLLETRRH